MVFNYPFCYDNVKNFIKNFYTKNGNLGGIQLKKRVLSLLCVCMLVFGAIAITGCSSGSAEGTTENYETEMATETIKIAVAVYSDEDPEVMLFRQYYEQYISETFSVDFLYSGAINDVDDEMHFLQDAVDAGAQGVITFVRYDLEADIAFCEENEIYYISGSGSLDEDAFNAVKDSPYFLGTIGPMEEQDQQAGKGMVDFLSEGDEAGENSYIVLSGGACYGSSAHYNRTESVLNELAAQYGFTYDVPVEDIVTSAEVMELDCGGIKITVIPGYLDIDETYDLAESYVTSGDYDNIISVLSMSYLYKAIRNMNEEINVATIDCFSEDNLKAMKNGTLNYISGRYAAMVGPTFVAMYNAVTGYSEDFRDNGEAFALSQEFWTAEDYKTYNELYGLSIGVFDNAYGFEDLEDCVKIYNSDASYEDLVVLAESDNMEE